MQQAGAPLTLTRIDKSQNHSIVVPTKKSSAPNFSPSNVRHHNTTSSHDTAEDDRPMSRGGKLRWLWRAPARALGRARDLYVRGMTGCARYAPGDAAFGYPVFAPAASLSPSHSGAGSDWGAGSGADEDLRELVRAASERRVEQRRAEARAVARSQSMAAALSMARIDEDAPCEFGAGEGADGPGALAARSRSCVAEASGRRAARGHRKVAAFL